MARIRTVMFFEATQDERLIIVDSDPSQSPGVDVGQGSIAVSLTGKVYYKSGATATDWTEGAHSILAALPTVDPADGVTIWNDGGVLKVPTGP